MNEKNRFQAIRTIMCVSALSAAIAGCAENEAINKPSPPVVAEVPALQAVAEPADAQGILKRMAAFLAQAPRFTFNLDSTYDVLQDSGQMLEFAEVRKITVSRPNDLRIESDDSSGEKHVVLYDGKDITVYSPTQKVYAQTNKPGGIDEAVMYFLRDLHMRLPLAMMLVSRFPEEIESRTRELDYVERTSIYGKPAHHLAGRTETVDYQVWIAEGAQPLPLRIVLTYKTEEGQPQYRAQFSDWNLTPQIQQAQFTFSPAAGVNKIAFLAQLPSLAPEAVVAPAQTGEQK
ncbi:DUF2092 domain-containing protein [Methylomonas sp. MgM2]